MNEMRMIDESVTVLYIGDMVCVHSLIYYGFVWHLTVALHRSISQIKITYFSIRYN